MTQIGIFTTDIHLVVQVWDATLAQLTGISEESASGQALTALLPDLEQRGLLKRFQRSLNEGVVELLALAFHHYLIPCAPVTPAKHFDKMHQRVTIAPLREVATKLRNELSPRQAELNSEVAKVYASRFTEKEIKDLLAFYQSPLGRKLIAEEPRALDQSMTYAQDWARRLSDEVVVKMRAEMKKLGHDL